jgi:signal transduction histidine kinase
LSLVDLSRLLREASDFWRPEARDREIQLTLDVASDLPTIRADEEKLRRVFDNLIKNAVEAIGRGPGRIAISASASDGDRIVVRITDTGPGLPQNLDIFRLFETTKPEGSGLGLPIVRQIVAAHGGGIKVANAQPHGAVFEIELARRGPAG